MSTQIPLFETKPNASTRAEDLPADVGHGLNARDFEVVADASGSGRRLRELVVGLALRGRLSRADLQGLTRAAIAWPSVQLGDVADCVLGKMLDRSKHTTGTSRPYLRNINVRWHSFDLGDLSEMFFEDKELVRYGAEPGDVLVCEGGEPGRAAVWTDTRPMLIQKAIHRVRPSEELLGSWVVLNLRYDTWNGRLESLFTGATIKHFTGKALSSYEIPLPPVAEQKRIIAKVDQLTGLCEQLETKQAEKQALGSRLTKASLEALTTAETPEEFALAWKRVSENFDTLIDRSEKVEDLRRAIRDFALRGRLTKQVSSERSGRSLLTKIEGHRTEQIRLKRSRRVVLPDSIESTDEPFPIPPNWAWSRLGHLCWKVADGPHFSPSYVAKEIGVPFLSGRNIKVEGFDLTNVKYVSKDDHDSFCSRTKPEPGDVLYTKGGTTGIALVNTLDFEFSVWVHVAVLKVTQDLVVPAYVAMALNSPHCYAQSQTLTHGIGNRDLGLTRMVQISLPLPPFEEQSRIVTQVEHMLKICDLLENRLRQAEELASKFAESVVRGVTA